MTNKIDINAVAKALAVALGGDHLPANRVGEFVDWYALVGVDMPAPMLPYHIGLSVKGYGADANKITATLHTAAASNMDVSQRGIDWPSAKVDGSRPIEKIVSDIARRVANSPQAQPALAEYAKRLADLKAREAGAKAHMAELLALPNVAESENYPTTPSGGRVFNRGGVYFDANVSSSGSVCFQRIGSVSLDQAKRILAILGEA